MGLEVLWPPLEEPPIMIDSGIVESWVLRYIFDCLVYKLGQKNTIAVAVR